MRVVMLLAVGALVALVIALVTGSTWPAVAVVVLAAIGIVVLLRDWRAERATPAEPVQHEPPAAETGGHDLSADEFSPDISTDPAGPSSDARSDQV